MNDDVVKIPGSFDFEQMSRTIMGEEAYGYVMVDSKIKSGANIVSFDFHPQGLYPTACRILPTTQSVPSGHTKEWTGQMLIESQVRNVMLCRKN
jgi:hypothetical protein